MNDTCAFDQDWSFGKTYAVEKGYEVWYMECMELVQVRFTHNISQGVRYVQIRFNGCTGG